MADQSPTYYNIDPIKTNGMKQEDAFKCIFNLYKAVYAICNNLDEDSGTLGTDYLSKIGTDLATAMAALGTPAGPTT